MREGDVLLQQWRPCGCGCISNLHVADHDRQTSAYCHAGDLWRQTNIFEDSLHSHPIYFESHQLPRRAFALLALQRAATDEVSWLIERHRPVESQLERRRLLRLDPSVACRCVINIEHEQS